MTGFNKGKIVDEVVAVCPTTKVTGFCRGKVVDEVVVCWKYLKRLKWQGSTRERL